MKRIILLIMMVFLVLSAYSGNKDKFYQYSYFKGENKYRVFIYITKNNISIAEMEKHASMQMYTAGATTVVFYYRNSNVDSIKYNVTTAPDFATAQDLACRKGCAAGWWKFPNGRTSFIEKPCEE